MGLFCAYEYASLLAEKKEKYEEFKEARKAMVEYQTAKDNVDRILGVAPLEKNWKKRKNSIADHKKSHAGQSVPAWDLFVIKQPFL